jgi:hypothetical protein
VSLLSPNGVAVLPAGQSLYFYHLSGILQKISKAGTAAKAGAAGNFIQGLADHRAVPAAEKRCSLSIGTVSPLARAGRP